MICSLIANTCFYFFGFVFLKKLNLYDLDEEFVQLSYYLPELAWKTLLLGMYIEEATFTIVILVTKSQTKSFVFLYSPCVMLNGIFS